MEKVGFGIEEELFVPEKFLVEHGQGEFVPDRPDLEVRQIIGLNLGKSVLSDKYYTDEDRWKMYARCRGMDPKIFFPENSAGVEAAQRECEKCPVRRECLDFALDHKEEHGVWGGESQRERARILRDRRRAG